MSDDFDPSTISWVMDEADLDHLLLVIDECEEVVFDVETTGLNEHAVHGGRSNGGVAARISLAQFTLPCPEDVGDPTTFVLPLSHPDSPWRTSWRRVLTRVAEQIRGPVSREPIFDPEDADLFEQGFVSNTGYWRRRFPGVKDSVAVHDLVAERALGERPEGWSVDHKNRDRLDNRRDNLRYVTRSGQMVNRRAWGASGVRGVYERPNGSFEAAVRRDGERKYLGVFKSRDEAADAVLREVGDLSDPGPEPIERTSQGKPIVGQNAKFDTRWIAATTGVSLSHLIAWDTRISSHLLDETRSTSLKQRAPETFGIPPWNDHDLTYPGASEDVPLIELGLYGARDTYWTWRLAQNHRYRMNLLDSEEPVGPEEIEEARLGRLATYVSMPTVASLGVIEERGIALDESWVERTYASHEETRARLRERLIGRYDLPGDPSFAPTSKWFMAWADVAVDAGDLRVAELTPTGRPRWSKAVLTRQSRRGYEVATDLLELRGVEKRMEYLRSWMEKVSPAGRIHATYNAGSVVSGRLSSSDPNMQQVTGLLKPAFIADEDRLFVDLDFSQIELRVAAYLSRSEAMLTAFRNGDDLHTRLASAIVNKPESEITKTERQAGKSANFGLLYGMGARGFREYAETVYGVMFTEEEAAKVHETYFETWDRLREWHLRSVERVRRDGQVTSPIGRVRRLPDIWDGNDERAAAAERAAINSPVQGLASDLMQMSAASINGLLPGVGPVVGAEIVGTVHDSILIEVPREDWQAVGRECQHRMETITTLLPDLFGIEFDVPLKADGVVSRRWGGEAIGEF